jgi:pimeloyl-ACP methyl ester carboxylesterase
MILLLSACLKKKFLLTLLFIFLTLVLLNLVWKMWLLTVPQPLPQESIITSDKKNSLLHGSYFETSIRPTSLTQYRPADYRIWIPDGVQIIRGLIVKQHGCHGDASTEMGLAHANDLQWQALALKHQLALVGSKRPVFELCDGKINRSSDDVLLVALRNLAEKSNHPEIEKIPWALWGHSGGADWGMYMLQKYPNRTIAVIAMRSGGILLSHSKPSELLTSTINPAVLEVPVLFAVGEKDPHVEESLELPKKVFNRYRKAGAPWAIAVEADAGHESTDTRLLAIPYLDTILTARLTDGTKLQPINQAEGWLANPANHTTTPTSQYKGDPLAAAWLPNKETAHKWQEYVTTPNFWSQKIYYLCSKKKLVKFLGAPHLTESCYSDKISPTRKPAAPFDLHATKIGKIDTILTWKYTPDLENGLPPSRIYRNHSLIATLQGQERNAVDVPQPPHVVLEYKDSESTGNDIYTVSTFNSLGESVSQTVEVMNH